MTFFFSFPYDNFRYSLPEPIFSTLVPRCPDNRGSSAFVIIHYSDVKRQWHKHVENSCFIQ